MDGTLIRGLSAPIDTKNESICIPHLASPSTLRITCTTAPQAYELIRSASKERLYPKFIVFTAFYHEKSTTFIFGLHETADLVELFTIHYTTRVSLIQPRIEPSTLLACGESVLLAYCVLIGFRFLSFQQLSKIADTGEAHPARKHGFEYLMHCLTR